MKLTQTAIAKFKMPKDKREHIEWDEAMPGFGLRCRAGDVREHRTFIVQYKIGAKHRRMTLGNAAKISAAAPMTYRCPRKLLPSSRRYRSERAVILSSVKARAASPAGLRPRPP
jgi:hypothetical protein